jgi:hypothetical protein
MWFSYTQEAPPPSSPSSPPAGLKALRASAPKADFGFFFPRFTSDAILSRRKRRGISNEPYPRLETLLANKDTKGFLKNVHISENDTVDITLSGENIIRLVQQPGWLSPKSCGFSGEALQNRIFSGSCSET